MGKKEGKKFLNLATLGASESDTVKDTLNITQGHEGSSDISGRTARKSAEEAQKRQSTSLFLQQQKEDIRLQEARSEVERRRKSPRNVGRASLITSNLSQTTGG